MCKTDENYNSDLISIMGCHGVGKSTIIAKLMKEFKFILPPEKAPNPFSDNAILSYIHYLIERKKQHDYFYSSKNNMFISDRYAFLDTSIYVEVLYKLGYCTSDERRLFANIVNNLDDKWSEPKILLILLCEPEEILHRIESRDKSSEQDFKPFDLNQISKVNQAFEHFGYKGECPSFLSTNLKNRISNAQRIVLDTTNESVDNTTIKIIKVIKELVSEND